MQTLVIDLKMFMCTLELLPPSNNPLEEKLVTKNTKKEKPLQICFQSLLLTLILLYYLLSLVNIQLSESWFILQLQIITKSQSLLVMKE